MERTVLVVLLAGLLLFSGCVADRVEGGREGSEPIVLGRGEVPLEELELELSVSTGKAVYSSNEDVEIRVEVIASRPAETVGIRVWGISPQGFDYLSAGKSVDLEKGLNVVEFVEKTPYCTSGCGGVNPGSYKIFAAAEVLGEEVVFAETDINLVSEEVIDE